MKKEEYLTPEFEVASIVFQDIMEANDSDPESRIIRDDNIPVVSG